MKYKLFLLSILLVVAASLISCNLLSSKPKREVRRYGDWRLELWVSQERASIGESIDLAFTMKNIGDETVIIEIDDNPVMDIVVGQGSDYQREVWWSDGREITPEMRRLELAPGESKTIEMTWFPIDPSDARVVGSLRYESPHEGQKTAQVHITICIEDCDSIGI